MKTQSQIKAWNTLRFGNRSPKQIRKHFTNHLYEDIKQFGLTFTGNISDDKVILIPNQKSNWYVYDKQNDVAFMTFKYVPGIKSFLVVNQEDHDFGVHIGWETESQNPYISVINNYDNDDMFSVVFTSDAYDAEYIGEHFCGIFEGIVLPLYRHRYRKSKWLTAIEKDFHS
jgi:hypothetical protein